MLIIARSDCREAARPKCLQQPCNVIHLILAPWSGTRVQFQDVMKVQETIRELLGKDVIAIFVSANL